MSMDTNRRQHHKYNRHVDDRASYTSSNRHQQGPLPPVPRTQRSYHNRQQYPRQRPSSPSSLSSSPYTDDETPMMRRQPPPSRRSRSRSGSRMSENHQMSTSGGHPGLMPLAPSTYGGYGNGTLRSSRSVPVLNMDTWDGEPCPVHGLGPPVAMLGPPIPTMRRSGSMFDMRSPSPFYPPPPQIPMYPPPQIPMYPPPPMMMPHPGPGYPMPSHLLPPMMRPRQLVIPAGTEPVQPLPVRDPMKGTLRPPSAMQMLPKKPDTRDNDDSDGSICKGHLVVLWIILGVVTLGVLLGIILGVIMG